MWGSVDHYEDMEVELQQCLRALEPTGELVFIMELLEYVQNH